MRLRMKQVKLGLMSATAIAIASPNAAFAQSSVEAKDANNVDLASLNFAISTTDVSIGDADGLKLVRTASLSSFVGHNWLVTAGPGVSNASFVIQANDLSDTFYSNGTTVSDYNGGSFQALTGGIYLYTAGTGAKYTFYDPSGTGNLVGDEIIYPNGHKIKLHWQGVLFCTKDIYDEDGDGDTDEIAYCQTYTRLQSVTDNRGYQIKFSYAAQIAVPSAQNDISDYYEWSRLVQTKAINNAVEVCDPDADSCSLSMSWPTATYTLNSDNSTTAVLPGSKTWNYKWSSIYSPLLPLQIQRPGSSSYDLTYNLSWTGTTQNVSVYNAGQTTTYSGDYSGVMFTGGVNKVVNTRTTALGLTNSVELEQYLQTLTYCGGWGCSTLTAWDTPAVITKTTDGVGNSSIYTYDHVSSQLLQAQYPEGNKAVYTYDGRGNRTSVTLKPKSGSGLSDIVTYAGFDSTCVYEAKCNQPNYTIDANGNQTDYTYDTTTGNPTTITRPAASSGGTRPQKRFSYTSRQAYYKNAAGTPGYSGQSIALLSSTSECISGSSCAGTANEVVTSFDYGPTGVANNLSQSSQTVAAGNGSLSATSALAYDRFGNMIAADGPLATSADTTVYRYDDARRLIGTVGPDPDGSGSLKPRAVRNTYNADDRLTKVEIGNVTDQSDTSWAAMSTSMSKDISYDAQGQATKTTTSSGGVTYSLSQASYDNDGRLSCSAIRMDASFPTPPTSACTLATPTATGPDRITKYTYDAANRITKMQSAYGTSDQADEATNTYTANGKIATTTDAEANKTTYAYDGFDRLSKTSLPSTTKGAGTSSTTDYEQLTYDPGSNVTNRRLRDGNSIGYTYDALNRITAKDVPTGSNYEFDITYAYDNLGRLTQALDSNTHVMNVAYDALSRKISEQSNWTNRYWQYDLAGRVTRLTWHDGFYVDYTYDVTGNMSSVRENGATSGIGVLATYAYDDLGRRTSLTRGNGAVTSYSYDAVSRLTSLANDLSGSTYDVTTTLGYNPAGQIVTNTRSNDNYAWAGAANVNRGYTTNGLNQFTASGGTSLGYDAKGNLTTSGVTTYSYTSENRLATAPGSYAMTYDPIGRYHWISAGGPITWMQYDGDHIIEERDGNGLQRRYIWGVSTDEPLVWYEGSGTSDRRFLIPDERGSIVAVTNASGTATAINTYDEYGIPGSSNVGRFQYTGQAWIPELGMYYYKARMYSPTLGRFMQTDPIGYGNGMNQYNYVTSDPINRSDPSGMYSCEKDFGRVTRVPGTAQGPQAGGDGDIHITGAVCGAPIDDSWSTSIFIIKRYSDEILRKTRGEQNLGLFPDLTKPGNYTRPCLPARRESGRITFQGVGGSGTAVIGVSAIRGTFLNTKTGTSGDFFQSSWNFGADVGAFFTAGEFNSLSSFSGGNDNRFSGVLGYSATDSYDLEGNLVGHSWSYGPGPLPFSAGTSFSVTELFNIKQTQRCERQ